MSTKTLADTAETFRRTGLAFLPPQARPLFADALRLHIRWDEAVRRVYAVCAAVEIDPQPIIAACAGSVEALEDAAYNIARWGSAAALSALAAELADA